MAWNSELEKDVAIDVEENLAARKKAWQEGGWYGCREFDSHNRWCVQHSETTVDLKDLERDFTRDFPAGPGESPTLEGVPLEFCSTQIVGEGTKYEMEGRGYPASWDNPDNSFQIIVVDDDSHRDQ